MSCVGVVDVFFFFCKHASVIVTMGTLVSLMTDQIRGF